MSVGMALLVIGLIVALLAHVWAGFAIGMVGLALVLSGRG